jgi:hypothetical protein
MHRNLAERPTAVDSSFAFRRKRIDGATCESTAYCHFGYDATGLCIAPGNYHNVGRARNRLAPEYLDMTDWEDLIRWFVALATTDLRYDGKPPGLCERLRKLEKTHRHGLRHTAGVPSGFPSAQAGGPP